jgi:hypothetical protein
MEYNIYYSYKYNHNTQYIKQDSVINIILKLC